MRIYKPLVAGLVACAIAAPALASGPGVYAYETDQNFCPSGLQPVSINGVICCGSPNQSQSYQQAMRHPVQSHVRGVVHRARPAETCAEGVKGCY